MSMYFIENLEPSGYQEILETLVSICDSFHLVEPHVAPELIETAEAPKAKLLLNDWLIETRRVTSWVGTEIRVSTPEEKAIEDRYICCEGSINVLKQYDSFFALDADMDIMDIAFFKKDVCVLYTTAEERAIIADMDYLEEVLDKIKCKKWKVA